MPVLDCVVRAQCVREFIFQSKRNLSFNRSTVTLRERSSLLERKHDMPPTNRNPCAPATFPDRSASPPFGTTTATSTLSPRAVNATSLSWSRLVFHQPGTAAAPRPPAAPAPVLAFAAAGRCGRASPTARAGPMLVPTL
jgi:hypothetical protein